jgi:hypothetical protein
MFHGTKTFMMIITLLTSLLTRLKMEIKDCGQYWKAISIKAEDRQQWHSFVES